MKDFKQQLKDMIDRPNLTGFDPFNKIFQELAPYMTAIEIDIIVDFMYDIEDSKYDINPTIGDAQTQIKLLIGSDRYQSIVDQWKKNNQKILSSFGTLKYKCKQTGQLYDGLEHFDDPNNFDKVYV
jgi:hypothetical protein